MLIAFRADADALTGTGHLMRCLALADALAARGARCIFLCRGAGLGPLASRVAAAGHELIALPETETGISADARASLKALTAHPKPDWLVVDHYGLDARWERELRAVASRIMVIDDLADRDHDCDLLLDQNLVADSGTRYTKRIRKGTVCLFGPRFALLRPEFAAHRDAALARAHPDEARRVLVMFGGADAQDLTGASVELLAKEGFAGHVDVVAGPLYRPLETLRGKLSVLPSSTLHIQSAEIAGLMSRADLAIGSPGVTSWERCVLGLPTIAIAVAANQEPLGEALSAAGALWYAGRKDSFESGAMRDIVLHALRDGSARIAMRRRAEQVCDGLGTQRVARRLLAGTGISLRPVRVDEAAMLHGWRNDPRVRRSSFDPSPLSLDAHVEWVRQTLSNPQRSLLLALERDVPVGCVRLDREGASAEVSIYLDPALVGGGLGTAVLHAAADWACANLPGLKQLTAAIRPENRASRAAFAAAGYARSDSVYRLALDHRSGAAALEKNA
jgi:UDP-2,4-diacetamido-2,4,6-trideoxy-beta-L-altropyranose hydrolase